jgi:hypothetical protein
MHLPNVEYRMDPHSVTGRNTQSVERGSQIILLKFHPVLIVIIIVEEAGGLPSRAFAIVHCKKNFSVSDRSIVRVTSLEDDFALITSPRVHLKVDVPSKQIHQLVGQLFPFMRGQDGLHDISLHLEAKHFSLVVQDYIFLPRSDGAVLFAAMKNT